MKRLIKSLLVLAMGLAMMPTANIEASSKIKINSTNFPDKSFRETVSIYDANGDGYFSKSELSSVDFLAFIDDNVKDFRGLKYFTNLETLYVCNVDTTKITGITYLKKLEDLYVDKTTFYKLDLDTVYADNIHVTEGLYAANDNKFPLKAINKKWDKNAVKVDSGARKSGSYLLKIQDEVELEYENAKGNDIDIELIFYPFMSAPTYLLATSSDYNKVNLSFYKNYYSIYTEVYRATSENGTYKKIATTKKEEITVSATSGKTYYYKVRGYRNVNGVKVTSGFSEPVKFTARLEPTILDSAEDLKNGNDFKLSWSKVKSADGYQIYSSTSFDGKYKKIATTTGLSKKVSLGSKDTRFYKVRAYKKENGKTYYGKFGNIAMAMRVYY